MTFGRDPDLCPDIFFHLSWEDKNVLVKAKDEWQAMQFTRRHCARPVGPITCIRMTDHDVEVCRGMGLIEYDATPVRDFTSTATPS